MDVGSLRGLSVPVLENKPENSRTFDGPWSMEALITDFPFKVVKMNHKKSRTSKKLVMRECRCYDLSAEDLGSFQGVFIPDLKNEPEKIQDLSQHKFTHGGPEKNILLQQKH